jgi:TatD DNase family protein
VKAVDELLAIRKEMGVKHPWVLHGYRGGPEQAEQLRKQGIYVSLGLDYNTDTLLDMPFEYLLLESDTYGDVDVLYKLVSEDMEANEQSVRSLVAKNIVAFLKSHDDASFE